MHTYVPCYELCHSGNNFVVAKSSSECFAAERIDKLRQFALCVTKYLTYITFR